MAKSIDNSIYRWEGVSHVEIKKINQTFSSMMGDKLRIPHLFSKVNDIHVHFLFFQALCQLDELQHQQVWNEAGRKDEKVQTHIDNRRVC